jgi:Leucine Rich repeat
LDRSSVNQFTNNMQAPKDIATWTATPYDIHRLIIDYINDGDDLLNYIRAFIASKTLGDIPLLLQVYSQCSLDAIDLWPKLILCNVKLQRPAAVTSIVNACHLFKHIVFSDNTSTRFLSLLVNSRRPIVEINMSWNGINDEHMLKMTPDLANSPICILNLSHNRIGDAGAQSLAGVLASTQIKSLNLNTNSISVLGCMSLSSVLRDCTHLAHLDISRNQINNEGCECLARGLAGSSVRILDVGYNMYGPCVCSAGDQPDEPEYSVQQCRRRGALSNVPRNEEITTKDFPVWVRGCKQCFVWRCSVC